MCVEISFLVCIKDEGGKPAFSLVHNHDLDSHGNLYPIARELGYTTDTMFECEIDASHISNNEVVAKNCEVYKWTTFVRKHNEGDITAKYVAEWLQKTYGTPQKLIDRIIEEEARGSHYAAVGFHSLIRTKPEEFAKRVFHLKFSYAEPGTVDESMALLLRNCTSHSPSFSMILALRGVFFSMNKMAQESKVTKKQIISMIELVQKIAMETPAFFTNPGAINILFKSNYFFGVCEEVYGEFVLGK